jgi:hypothetical protein
MAGSDEDQNKSMRLGADNRDDQAQVGYLMARRSGG